MSIESELIEGLKKAGQDNIALPSSMPVEEQRDKAMENIAKPIAEAIEKGVHIEFKGTLTCAEIARLQNVSVGDVYICSDEGVVGELECRNGTAVIWTEDGWLKFFEIDLESIGISREEVSSMIAAAVSVEVTARANADTALGERIDSEASARESADDALDARIDGKAPTNHASTATTYGVGDATKYGHVKVDSALSASSTNPVQNKVVKAALDGKQDVAKLASEIASDNGIIQILRVPPYTSLPGQNGVEILLYDVTSYFDGTIVTKDNDTVLADGVVHIAKPQEYGTPEIFMFSAKVSYTQNNSYLYSSHPKYGPHIISRDEDGITKYYLSIFYEYTLYSRGAIIEGRFYWYSSNSEYSHSSGLIGTAQPYKQSSDILWNTVKTHGSNTWAAKLETARTVQTNLGSTAPSSFDGSANITPGIAGTLPITHGGTGATTAANARTNLDVYSKGEVDDALDGYVYGLANWASSDLGVTKYVPMADSVSGNTKKASLNAIRTYVRDGMPTSSDLNAVASTAHDELTSGLSGKQDTLPLVSGTTDYDIAVDTARRSGYSWYTSGGNFYGLYLAETNFGNDTSTDQLTFEAFVTIDNSSDASGSTAGNLTMLVKVRGRGPNDIGCEIKVLSRGGFYGDRRVQPKLVLGRKTSATDYNYFIAIQFVDINSLQAVEIINRNYVYVHPLSNFESCDINLDKAYGAIPYVAYETQPIDFSGVAYVLKDATNSGSPAGWAKAYFNGMTKYTTRFVYNQAGSEKLLIFAKGGDGYGTIVRIGYDSTAVQLLRLENGSWKTSDWEGIDAHTIDGHVISIGTYSSVPGAISFV